MARIVLLKGASPYGTKGVLTEQLALAFRRLGHDSGVVDLAGGDRRGALRDAFDRPCDLVVSIDGLGHEITYEGHSLYRVLDVPFLALLLEHPLRHLPLLEDTRRWDNLVVTVVDRDHLEFVRRCVPLAGSSAFLPHPGCRVAGPVVEGERPIDVLFAGSFEDPGPPPEQWGGAPQGLLNLVGDIAECALASDNLPLDHVASHVLEARGLHLARAARATLRHLLLRVDRYIRARRRVDALRLLAREGIRVDLFGRGFERLPFPHSHRIHKEVPFRRLLQLMRNARVVLNIGSNLAYGAHERALSAMQQGAALLTDHNPFYEDHFDIGRELLAWKWSEIGALPEQLDGLLSSESLRRSVAEAGCKRAREEHGPEARAREILEITDTHWGLAHLPRAACVA